MGLSKYEDQNVEYYSDADVSKKILTHPSSGDIKERMDVVSKQWKNSYKDAYMWFKSELLDIKGLADALAGREHVVKQQSATESKKRSD